MTSQLQQAINLAQSLSFTQQLELLKTLSTIIQQTHCLEKQITPEANIDFSGESFRTSWRQAVTHLIKPIFPLANQFTVPKSQLNLRSQYRTHGPSCPKLCSQR